MSSGVDCKEPIENFHKGILEFEKPPQHIEDGDDVILPYSMGYLTPSMVKEAKFKLKETDESRPRCLAELRQLVLNEPNLVSRLDDNFMLMFLRARKFNVERAFKLMQNYWKFRSDYRDFFESYGPEEGKKLIYKNYFGFLPYRDRMGCIVATIKVGMWDPEVDNLEKLFNVGSGIITHSNEDPATQVMGYRLILDARGVNWSHMKQCTLSNILLVIRATQDCFPARYKKFHILSDNKLFKIAYSIVYPLLTKKLKKRVVLHNTDMSPLREFIHPSVLPEEYGGDGEPFDNTSWSHIVERDTPKLFKLLVYGYKDKE